MRIIEKFIEGKKADQALCEDKLLITEDFIAVVDGVTAKSSRTWDGKTGGIAAAEAICKAIELFPADISCENAITNLTKAVSFLYDENEEPGSAAAGVIILSRFRKEIWSVGDCCCIINGTKHLHEKALDLILSAERCAFLENAVKNGATEEELLKNDTGRDHIMPKLKAQHKYANTVCELGFGVINGSAVPERFIVTYKVHEGDTIILASDGYPHLRDTLEESEKLLKKELTENPLCYKTYKSTKGLREGSTSFDDRTYIKLIL